MKTSPPPVIANIPRDPSQPQSGSISDVHNETLNGEEIDIFPTNIPFRPRAHTCPESRTLLRKVKARIRNRPPTPPPTDLDYTQLQHELSKLSIHDKLHIAAREDPVCIPEAPQDQEEGTLTDGDYGEIFLMDDG